MNLVILAIRTYERRSDTGTVTVARSAIALLNGARLALIDPDQGTDEKTFIKVPLQAKETRALLESWPKDGITESGRQWLWQRH
jgi:hypothetical protein